MYEVPVIHAAPLAKQWKEPVVPAPAGEGLIGWVRAMRYHRKWEAMPVTFTVLVTVAVAVASLLEIIPTFLIKSNVPTIAIRKVFKHRDTRRPPRPETCGRLGP